MRPLHLSPPRGRARASARVAVVVTTAAICTLLLAACQGTSRPDASPTTGTGRSPATATTGSTASSSATPTATPTPVSIPCDRLLTSVQLAALLPPLTPAAGFTPAKGSDAAHAAADAGTVCGYTNPKTGNTVAVSVSRPTPDDLTGLKGQAVSTSHVVPTYGTPPTVIGYFTVTEGVGEAQAFTGDYWVTASSKDWIEPGDAGQVMTDVLAGLSG